MINAFDRIVIAVPDLAAAAADYGLLLGGDFWPVPADDFAAPCAWLGLKNVVIELREQHVEKSILVGIIFIDDSAGLSPTEIRARARRLHREHNLGLIVIDYLQLMQVPGNNEGRTSEISEISRSLKSLAREMDVPIVCLSQVGRQSEGKAPSLADLRESGSIEQDADVVMFIYRDVVYNPESEDPRQTEILIRKQRNGPIGEIFLDFEGQYTRFFNRSSRKDIPPEADSSDFEPAF